MGEKNPAPRVEKNITAKAELIAALKGAFAYCDGAYNGLTDANASQTVKFMGTDAPKLGVLTVNQVHAIEHYGNLVTYMHADERPHPADQRARVHEAAREVARIAGIQSQSEKGSEP